MIEFLASDLIADAVGDRAKRCEDYDVNIRYILDSAAMEQWFWDVYQNTLLKDLSAFWYLDRIAPFAVAPSVQTTEDIVLGWPNASEWAMVSGNIMSTMRFLPDDYDVVPGLIIDQVTWMNTTGDAISRVDQSMMGSGGNLRVKFYSAYDFNDEITLKVRGDLPGFAQAGDPIAGSHTETFTIDPRAYVHGAPSIIETDFMVGAALVDGFYFEMYAGDNDKPFFTSSWDAINTSGEVPVYQAIYRDNFATYGKWPPSLPMAEGLGASDCEVFVVSRTFPHGGPILDSETSLIPGDVGDLTIEPRTLLTKSNCIAAFDQVTAGTYTVSTETLSGYVAVDTEPTALTCDPTTQGQHWIFHEFHVVPKVWVPGGISGANDCIVLETNAEDFWNKADKFVITNTDFFTDSEIVPQTEKNARARIEVCFPTPVENGTTIIVHVLPRYKDDQGTGIEGVSDPILIDATVPIINDIAFSAIDDTCPEGAGVFPF